MNTARSLSLEDYALLLAQALSPVPLSAQRRERLRARVQAQARPRKLGTVRAEEGAWVGYLPGIEIKVLRLDAKSGTETALWRLNPGAQIPAHPHKLEEECLIVEGALIVDEVEYRAGDFLVASPGSRDPVFYAPEGALLLIRAELRPQLSP